MANDFDALLRRVTAEALRIGIPVSRRIRPRVKVNTRASGRFGLCRRTADGFEIELTGRLLEAEERACLQTLAHEVLHTCPGCQDHGPRWKGYAERMRLQYGYDIRRTDTCESLGVPDTRKARWAVRCAACGKAFTRQRRSALVAHPERYRCRCGGRLFVTPLEEKEEPV